MTKRLFADMLDYKQALNAENNSAHPHILERIKEEFTAADARLFNSLDICSQIFKSNKNMDDFEHKLHTFEAEKHYKTVPNPELLRTQWEELRAATQNLPDDKEILHAHKLKMQALQTQYFEHMQALQVEEFRKAEAECLRLIANREECATLREDIMNDSLDGWNRPI